MTTSNEKDDCLLAALAELNRHIESLPDEDTRFISACAARDGVVQAILDGLKDAPAKPETFKPCPAPLPMKLPRSTEGDLAKANVNVKQTRSAAAALWSAFCWAGTGESHDYWQDVTERLDHIADTAEQLQKSKEVNEDADD